MPLARRLARFVPLGARLVGPLVYQPDQGVPSGLRRLSTRVNQALAERGYSAPWLWSPERCQAYWASQGSPSSPNHPATYVAKSPAIVDFLQGFWTPEVGPGSSILELGSNAGPNLNHSRKLGYSDRSGVEINPTAIEAMREAFPDLARTARISRGSLEDLGCKQLKSVMISRESSPALADYHGYVARLFSVPGSSHRPAAP